MQVKFRLSAKCITLSLCHSIVLLACLKIFAGTRLKRPRRHNLHWHLCDAVSVDERKQRLEWTKVSASRIHSYCGKSAICLFPGKSFCQGRNIPRADNSHDLHWIHVTSISYILHICHWSPNICFLPISRLSFHATNDCTEQQMRTRILDFPKKMLVFFRCIYDR